MIDVRIRGVGLWAPGVADWSQASSVLGDGGNWPQPAAGRPAPALMPANERRRAPESVLLALAVAEQAFAAAVVDAATVPSVFASIYGDLAINDYMCATLRDDASTMSPIRFHNSVHNAPSGYWSIATGAMAATSSVAAGRDTFAAGLFEAVSQSVDCGGPVLLAAYDSSGSGPVAVTSYVSHSFACALLLDATDGDGPRLRLHTGDATAATKPADTGSDAQLAALCAGNPTAASALPLLHALATTTPASLVLPLSAGLALHLDLLP